MTPLPASERAPQPRPWHRLEDGFAVTVLAFMAVLPVFSVLSRWITGDSVAWANVWVQSLNLWLTFAGGALAARTGAHLALSTGHALHLKGAARAVVDGLTSAVATAVTLMLAVASVRFITSEMESSAELPGGLPVWAAQIPMAVGFLVIAWRFAWRGFHTHIGRVLELAAIGLVVGMAYVPPDDRGVLVWVGVGVLAVAVGLGAPLFTAMGGLAMLLFWGQPIPIDIAAVPLETVRIVQDPTLTSLPLFTLAGYLLAEGGSSRRLVGLFQTCFGWMPGGVGAAAVVACAFFTTFTGASGVTILALGGLLLPALESAGYPRRFSIGLLAASGSIGLLFPPSLPVILYGVAAQIPITDLFKGGVVPGLLLVGLLVSASVVVALRTHGLAHYTVSEQPFSERLGERSRAIVISLWHAKWEVLLPVGVLVGIFGGYVTIFEAAAFTAVYAFIIEVVIHRDLALRGDVPRVVVECAKLMGGVLIILGVALGFTNYLVDAEVPMTVQHWVQSNIGHRVVFLLMLNLILLGVGCLMDIYSAIVVVVPLIIPVSTAFGIHPAHLGILFLANLELGYLTPPIGLNLFLASFRFNMPLTQVYRAALPFLGILAVGVLIITYVPYATTWALDDAPATNQSVDFFNDEPAAEGEAATQPAQLDPALLEQLLGEDALLDELPELPALQENQDAPSATSADDPSQKGNTEAGKLDMDDLWDQLGD